MRSVLGVVLILLLSATVAAAAEVGTVVGLRGPCFVESGGSRRALALGAALALGDTVEAPGRCKLRLRMADGSIVAVAPGTRLTIAAYAVARGGRRQRATLSLTRGLLRAIVAPMRHPAGFEVETAISVAGVRSTDWFVEATAAEDRIVVLRGSVAVTGKATGGGAIVPARRKTIVAAGQDPLPPRVATQAEIARLIARTSLPQRRQPRRRSEQPRPPAYVPEYTAPSDSLEPYPDRPQPYQRYPAGPPLYRPPVPQYPYPPPPTFGGPGGLPVPQPGGLPSRRP